MSTADHAGRPVGPPTAGRAPYADGGNAGAARSGGTGSGALRRLAEAETSSATAPTSSQNPTRPVPVQREAQQPVAAPATTPIPKYPPGSPQADAEARRSEPGRQEPSRQVGAPTPAPTRRTDAHAPARPAPARRVRLTVSRIDPWSAMKMSFLLSVALGIAGVVAVAVLWTVLEGMGVFDQVNGVIGQVIQDGSQKFNILDFIGFTRVVSLSIVIGVVDVILITAISTIGAFLYNVSSALVGGVQLTLTDD